MSVSGAVIAQATTTAVGTQVGAAVLVEGDGGVSEETGRGADSTVVVVIVSELSWGLRERVMKTETKRRDIYTR